jgi:DNA polymerase III delta subunit
MKLRPEGLFNAQISGCCLLYGNNPNIEDFVALELLPQRFAAGKHEIKTYTEPEVLAISKERLYFESSLFEPVKLYIIRDVTDKFLGLLQSYDGRVPLVMVGKNLKSSSKIVTHMNTHTSYQSVGIYGDDQQFLGAYIQYKLHGIALQPGVVGMILNHYTTFSLIRQQVDILRQLFSSESTISVEQVEASLIPVQQIEVFKVAEVVVSKNPKVMLDTFQKAGHIFEKESIPLLRIIAKQLWDLIALRRQMDKGVSAQQVVNQATPMIPFNRRPQLIHNLSKWTVRGLLNAIVKLDELEVLAKQPHLSSADQMERAFLQMSKF